MCKSQKSHSLLAKFAVAAVVSPLAVGLACFSAQAANAAGPAAAVSSSAAARTDAPRCDTYKAADGSTYFALTLPPVAVEPTGACDMLVFFDTSASQAGVVRDKALDALDMLL